MKTTLAPAGTGPITFVAAPRDTRRESRKAEAEAIRRGHFFLFPLRRWTLIPPPVSGFAVGSLIMVGNILRWRGG